MPVIKVLRNCNCLFLFLKIIGKSKYNYKYNNYFETLIRLILINIYILCIEIYMLMFLIICIDYIKVEIVISCLLPLGYAYIKAYIKAFPNILKLRIK